MWLEPQIRLHQLPSVARIFRQPADLALSFWAAGINPMTPFCCSNRHLLGFRTDLALAILLPLASATQAAEGGVIKLITPEQAAAGVGSGQ
jgi:hypothetical protein